jgi:hypothetical protein
MSKGVLLCQELCTPAVCLDTLDFVETNFNEPSAGCVNNIGH